MRTEEIGLSLKMTLQEKLDFIDGEIRKIHMFCTKAGYSASQIESFAKPFFERNGHTFNTAIWVSGKAWKRRAVALVTVVVATVFLFKFDPAFRLVCAISKQGAAQILPLWDWASIYDTHCLVENPLFQKTDLEVSDCEICEGTEKIVHIRKLSQEQFFRYAERDVPVIVKDGMHDWDNVNNISIDQIAQMYTKDNILKDYHSCHFTSNIRLRSQDHIVLLGMYKDGELDKFYAQWENCVLKVAKAFRKIYKRPYFLPSVASIIQSNWLFIAANYSGKIYKRINVSAEMFLFMQLKGESFVKIQARNPCENICPSFEDMLHQGEIMFAPNRLWRMEYLPSDSPENIAIAVEGSFNV